MENMQVAQPLRDIINMLEERYRLAVKAVGLATAAYSQAKTIPEIETAFVCVEEAQFELDNARRMMQASRAGMPYPKYKGD